MKLYAFLPSTRVLAIMALKDHLEIECEVQAIDLSKGDQRTPEYAALNPNLKMPMLEDDGFVLWESNAILFGRRTGSVGSANGAARDGFSRDRAMVRSNCGTSSVAPCAGGEGRIDGCLADGSCSQRAPATRINQG